MRRLRDRGDLVDFGSDQVINQLAFVTLARELQRHFALGCEDKTGFCDEMRLDVLKQVCRRRLALLLEQLYAHLAQIQTDRLLAVELDVKHALAFVGRELVGAQRLCEGRPPTARLFPFLFLATLALLWRLGCGFSHRGTVIRKL